MTEFRRRPLPVSIQPVNMRWRPPPREPWLADRALAVGLVAVALAALVALAMALGLTAPFDRAGLVLWRLADGAPAGPGWLVPLFRTVTWLGDAAVAPALGLLLAVLVGWKRGPVTGFCQFLVFGVGWMAVSDLRGAFARARPALVPTLAPFAGPSFPSSHSFNAAMVLAACGFALPWLMTRPPRAGLVALALLAALVAFSRVWLGVHWPTDALAGWLFGLGWAALGYAALQRVARREGRAR